MPKQLRIKASFPFKVAQAIKREAKRRGISEADVIRIAVAEWLLALKVKG